MIVHLTTIIIINLLSILEDHEDIQKVYFAGIIDSCEHPEKPTLGHGNMNAALCDAVVAVENTQKPSLAVADTLER